MQCVHNDPEHKFMFRCLNWNLRLNLFNTNSCSSKYRTLLFSSKQRLLSSGLLEAPCLFSQMSPTERVIVHRPCGKKEGDFSNKLWGCEKVWSPPVCFCCDLTHWAASEMTSLVANEIAVVLVNCKSYRNEFWSFTLLWNQSVKSI